jgi:hypothetical protein
MQATRTGQSRKLGKESCLDTYVVRHFKWADGAYIWNILIVHTQMVQDFLASQQQLQQMQRR